MLTNTLSSGKIIKIIIFIKNVITIKCMFSLTFMPGLNKTKEPEMNKALKIFYIAAAAVILSSLLIPISSNRAAAEARTYADVFPDRALAQAAAEAHQETMHGYTGPDLGADSEIYEHLEWITILSVSENVSSLEGLQELTGLEGLELLGKNNTFTAFPDFSSGHYLQYAEISSHKLSSLVNLKINGRLTISDVPKSLIEDKAPAENTDIVCLDLYNTDIASFDFLINFPGLSDLTVENAPDVSDFSGLYSRIPSDLYTLRLKNVGTNVQSASLNIKNLFSGSLNQVSRLYLDGVKADFTGMTENSASEMVTHLTLNNMGRSDFSGIAPFSGLRTLTLRDNKFTSIEGLENIMVIRKDSLPKFVDADLSNTEPRSSNNAIRDISPLENIPEQGSFRFAAVNQYITENAVSWSPEYEMQNVIKTGNLNLTGRINAPGNASYTVEYDSINDRVIWKNIPADAKEISYEFSYETKDVDPPVIHLSAPGTKDMYMPLAAEGITARNGIIFSGTVTVPIKQAQVKSFNVIYHANNGSASPETMTDSRGPYSEGSAAEVLGNDITGFKKDNRIFIGWNPDAAEASAGAADPAYDPGKEFAVPDHDTELYAVWKEVTVPPQKSDDPPDPPENPSSPKTGDSSSARLCLSVMLMSAAAAAVLTAAGKTGKQTGKQ